MDKYTGKRLDARYEIQELIGVGGMAIVYPRLDSIGFTWIIYLTLFIPVSSM